MSGFERELLSTLQEAPNMEPTPPPPPQFCPLQMRMRFFVFFYPLARHATDEFGREGRGEI